MSSLVKLLIIVSPSSHALHQPCISHPFLHPLLFICVTLLFNAAQTQRFLYKTDSGVRSFSAESYMPSTSGSSRLSDRITFILFESRSYKSYLVKFMTYRKNVHSMIFGSKNDYCLNDMGIPNVAKNAQPIEPRIDFTRQLIRELCWVCVLSFVYAATGTRINSWQNVMGAQRQGQCGVARSWWVRCDRVRVTT